MARDALLTRLTFLGFIAAGASGPATGLAGCGGEISDGGASTTDGDASTGSFDGNMTAEADGSSSSDAGTGVSDPPRVIWDASPEGAPSDLGYYPSTCIARAGDAPPPESPYIGPGYTRAPTTARTREDLLAICTQDVYTRLMSEYCAAPHDTRPVQWSMIMYYGQEWTGCAAIGCEYHGCP